MNRALFLDRDGVLNELVYYESSREWESPRNAADVTMIDGANEPLRRFVDAGWRLVIVTNQPSYAKGKTSKEDLLDAHSAVLDSLNVPIARSFVCFHHPNASVAELRVICACRKPGIQFLEDAARELDLDLSVSWMVGDQDTDLACGRAAGCRVALIEHPGSAHKRGTIEPDLRCRNLSELANALIPTSSASL